MIIVLIKEGFRLRFAELVEERPKTYKIKTIPQVSWINSLYGSVARKEQVIYKGELLDVAVEIDNYNAKVTEFEEEREKLYNKYRDILAEIENQIKSKS